MTKYYKILRNGNESAHGGCFKWSVPADDQPGSWHEVKGELRLCSTGFHLTTNPAKWWLEDADCYEAEFEGETTAFDEVDCKLACRKVRLVRKLEKAELEQFQIFYTGAHEIRSGLCLAYNSSTVTAYGSSTVTACNSSTVTAYDSSTVTACNSSTVTACNSSTVTACNSSTVTAYDSSTVTAYDSSTVTAYDSSTVKAYNSSTVKASDQAVVIVPSHYSPFKGSVSVSNQAVCINRQAKIIEGVV